MTQTLYKAFTETPILAVFIVMFAGIAASLSSCTIVRLPVVLGIVSGTAESKKKAISLSLFFSLGLMVSYTLMGTAFGLVTNFAGKLVVWSKYIFFVSGILLFLLGAVIAGLIKVKYAQKCRSIANRFQRFGTMGIFLFGILFAFFEIPGCPCCGPVLLIIASIVAVKGSVLYSLLIFVSFAVGQSLPILGAGCSVGLMKSWVPKIEKYENAIRFLAGNILLVLGIFFILVS
jgi:cytochrome c biogenesis protein CcdA